MQSNEFDWFEIAEMLVECESGASRKADLLFGCKCTEGESCGVCSPPEDESEIIFDSSLSLKQKLAKLQVLRGGKAIKPRSFRKRITRSDSVHAHGMGVRL